MTLANNKTAALLVSFFSGVVISFFVSYLIFGADKSGGSLMLEQNSSIAPPKQAAQIQEPQITPKEILLVSPDMQNDNFKSFEAPQQPTCTKETQQTDASPPQKVKPEPTIYIETKEANPALLLEERFKKNGDFESALALCEEYYKNEEYQKALQWAINANSIDSKNEKSWALFAKASVKLGRKQNAESALENFARTSGSENIKTLLRQIKAGEI